MARQAEPKLTWGYLEDTELYGRPTSTEDIIIVAKDNLSAELKGAYQASHVLIFAKNKEKNFGLYEIRASILMQLRFDGYLGFPGGLSDPGEDPEYALNRELKEEMGLDLTKYSITSKNHIVSHYNKKTGFVTHFYALEVGVKDLLEIELQALNAQDFGKEVLGNTRIPLYTMGDGYRGFPAFLNNQFIGNAKEQLLITINKLGLMTEEEIRSALEAKPSDM